MKKRLRFKNKVTSLLLIFTLALMIVGLSATPSYATSNSGYLPGGANYLEYENIGLNGTSLNMIDPIKLKPNTQYTLAVKQIEQGLFLTISDYSSFNYDDYIENTGLEVEYGGDTWLLYTFTSDSDPAVNLEEFSMNIPYLTYIVSNATEFYDTFKLEEGSTFTGPEAYVAPVTDETPPIIDGFTGVWLTNVDNPDSVADVKATLTATDNYDGDITANITVPTDNYTGNEGTLGDYNVVFSVTDSNGNSTSITVIMRVVDIVDPIINLLGGTTIYVEYPNSFTDPGYSATDNYDSSVTVNVTGSVNTSVLGSYNLNYNAADSSGNTATQKTRTVIVQDTTAPDITLSGSSTVYVEFGQNYSEPGATCTDNYDGSCSVNITGSVNGAVLGTYTLYYNVTDSNGNVATQKTRTVVVRDTTAPAITAEASYSYSTSTSIYLDKILESVTASDIYDGDLTSAITVTTNNFNDQGDTVGTYSVTISVSDSQGNTATHTFDVIIYDDEPPVFTTTATILSQAYADSMTQQDLKDYFSGS